MKDSDPRNTGSRHDLRVGAFGLLVSVCVVWALGERAVHRYESLSGVEWLILGRWIPRLVLLMIAIASIAMFARPSIAGIVIGFAALVLICAATYGIEYLHYYIHFGPQPAIVK